MNHYNAWQCNDSMAVNLFLPSLNAFLLLVEEKMSKCMGAGRKTMIMARSIHAIGVKLCLQYLNNEVNFSWLAVMACLVFFFFIWQQMRTSRSQWWCRNAENMKMWASALRDERVEHMFSLGISQWTEKADVRRTDLPLVVCQWRNEMDDTTNKSLSETASIHPSTQKKSPS